MKKLFLLALVATMSMTSCSKEENEVSLSKMSYTLYHSQNEKIQGTNVNNLNWQSNNDFVAIISDGVIKGQFVGKTNVHESAHGLSFNVEVKPKYNLYDEPDMDWGTSIATIKSRYGTPYSSNSESLIYKSDNKNAPYYIYVFKNGIMQSCGLVVPLSAASLLVDFLSERYLTYDVDMSKYTANFAHCYGSIVNPQIDYIIEMAYSSSMGGIVVAYVPTNTKANVAVNEKIADFLIDVKIEK